MIDLEGCMPCFVQAVSSTVEGGAEQDQLLSTSMNRFANHIIDQPRPDHGGTSCVRPSEVQKRAHKSAYPGSGRFERAT